MLRKKGVMSVVVVVLAFGIIGAGIYWFTRSSEAPSADVTAWYSFLPQEESIAQDAIANSFSQEYPEIAVDFLNIVDLRTRALVAIPAGNGPDCFTWSHDWTGEFAAAGHLWPLTDFVSPELIEKFTPEAIQACTYEGSIYGLPYASETYALIYNKAMIETPPETMEELIQAMETAMAEGLRYGIGYPVETGCVSPWIHAFGGWVLNDEDGSIGVDSEGTMNGIRYWIETFKPYMPVDLTRTVQTSVFLANLAPFLVDGPWVIPAVRGAGIDFGVVPLPKITELDRWPEPYTGFKMLWLTSAAENKESAFEFIKWFCTDQDHIRARADQAKFVPVLNETLDLEWVQADPAISGFAEAVKFGRPYPKRPEMGLFWSPVDSAITQAFLEPERLEEYFAEAQSDIEAKIAETDR